MKYPTSPGWYELNDTTEYDGSAVRIKPSYMTTSEFKAKLDSHRSEVLKDIRRDGRPMSHTPWTREDAEKWAEKWWVDFPGDSRVDPMDGETFRGWTETHKQAFIAGMAKAAEMIEACPTLYGDTVYTSWGEFESHEDTHSAKLVGVRPIEGSEK